MITHIIEVEKKLKDYNILTFQLRGSLNKVPFMNTMTRVLSEMKQSEMVSLYLEISSLDGLELDTVWKSLKFAVSQLSEYLSHINKIAVIADKNWMTDFAAASGELSPTVENKAFTFEDKNSAIQWLKRG